MVQVGGSANLVKINLPTIFILMKIQFLLCQKDKNEAINFITTPLRQMGYIVRLLKHTWKCNFKTFKILFRFYLPTAYGVRPITNSGRFRR
jgi:hypothetical protein